MKFFAKFFKLIGIKVLKFQKYLKLVNSEKNYIKNLEQTEKYKIIFNRDSNLITFDHEDEDMNSIMEQIWKPSNTYFEQSSTQNVSNTKN